MHDRNGKPVKVGDRVNVPCVITSVNGQPEYCNAQIETVEGMPPTGSKSSWTVNTKQVEKID